MATRRSSHPWPCSQHLEPGTNLVALRLDGPELGAIVSIRESGDQFAGGDPLASST